MRAFTRKEIAAFAVNLSFSGETCGKCKKTANVLIPESEWRCDCDHFNMLSWRHSRRPYNSPDMGTSLLAINEGRAANTPLQELLAKMGVKS